MRSSEQVVCGGVGTIFSYMNKLDPHALPLWKKKKMVTAISGSDKWQR